MQDLDCLLQGGKALEHCIQTNYALADVASVSTACCAAISGVPHPWIELQKEIYDRKGARAGSYDVLLLVSRVLTGLSLG